MFESLSYKVSIIEELSQEFNDTNKFGRLVYLHNDLTEDEIKIVEGE